MKQTLDINEIYYSIEDSGKRAGAPCVFIRLAGCNLDCSYCDTQYQNKVMKIEEVVASAMRFSCFNVTITGGEPLAQENVYLLIGALLRNGYDINIETNGSYPLIENRPSDGLFFTMDWKTSSSGENQAMRRRNILLLKKQDVLKFVVGSSEDLEEVSDIYECIPHEVQVYISPVHGKIDPLAIVDFIKEKGIENMRLQLQLRRILWGADVKGV